MNTNLQLIILHIDLKTTTNGCLLEENIDSIQQIISRPLSQSDIDSGLRDILLEYLELNPAWVRFVLMDVQTKEDNINIVYACLIPEIIKNKKGKWIPLNEIHNTEIKNILFQASQRVSTHH